MALNSERDIRLTLKRLAGQRCALVLQPGNVWVIENALGYSEQIEAALNTAHMRGWVEQIHNAVPSGTLGPNGELPPPDKLVTRISPLWRLTEGGWAVVNRSHGWALAAIVISALSFAVSVSSLVLSIKPAHP